jgi:G:T-mismatch repair DNA endonuclease (very short patch repair protein)
MKSKMFKNCVEIIKFEKVGRNNFAYFENGEKLSSGDLGKIEIRCYKCKSLTQVGFRSALLKNEYMCQSCNKVGESNPFYGKNHTTETKKQQSHFMKDRFVGENNAFYGKTHTDETKEILRQKCARYGNDNGFYGKTHTDEFKKKQSEFMKTVGKRPKEYYSLMGIKSVNSRPKKTKIEKTTEQKLQKLGVNFKYNFILHNKAQYDFLINSNIVLEVHGDFWHGNPEVYNILTERQEYKKQRDIVKQKLAEDNGYRYLVIWESQIKENDWSILDEI